MTRYSRAALVCGASRASARAVARRLREPSTRSGGELWHLMMSTAGCGLPMAVGYAVADIRMPLCVCRADGCGGGDSDGGELMLVAVAVGSWCWCCFWLRWWWMVVVMMWMIPGEGGSAAALPWLG